MSRRQSQQWCGRERRHQRWHHLLDLMKTADRAADSSGRRQPIPLKPMKTFLTAACALALKRPTPIQRLTRGFDAATRCLRKRWYPCVGPVAKHGLGRWESIAAHSVPYFYYAPEACNKRRPGSGCAASKVSNRGHPFLGATMHASLRIRPTWRRAVALKRKSSSWVRQQVATRSLSETFTSCLARPRTLRQYLSRAR